MKNREKNREIVSEHPGPETINRLPLNNQANKKPFSRRLKNYFKGVVAVAILASGDKVGLELNHRAEVAKANQARETGLIQNAMRNGTSVANLEVVVKPGVNIRTQPAEFNDYCKFLGVATKALPWEGNIASTVPNGEDLLVKNPIVEKVNGGDTWFGFQNSNGTFVNAEKPASVNEIANNTYWIDISQIENQEEVDHKSYVWIISPNGDRSTTIPNNVQYQSATPNKAGQWVVSTNHGSNVVAWGFQTSQSTTAAIANFTGNPGL